MPVRHRKNRVGLDGGQGAAQAAAGLSEQLRALEVRVQALESQMPRHLPEQDEVTRLRLGSLEHSQEDQEARLRQLAEAVAKLSTSASLAQVAQAAFALILSAIAAYLGRR